MAVTRQFKRPAPLDFVDYPDTDFSKVILWDTLDISTNTYSASIKKRGTNVTLLSFTVVSDASSVTISLTPSDKAGLALGDYLWDLLEITPTSPNGKYFYQGTYSLVEGATG